MDKGSMRVLGGLEGLGIRIYEGSTSAPANYSGFGLKDGEGGFLL